MSQKAQDKAFEKNVKEFRKILARRAKSIATVEAKFDSEEKGFLSFFSDEIQSKIVKASAEAQSQPSEDLPSGE